MKAALYSLFALLVFIAAPYPALSSYGLDKLDMGLKVGEHVPDIHVTDHEGSEVKLPEASGQNGLIIIFSRSMDWCPFCQEQALDWNKRSSEFEALGYNVALITYDSIDTLATFSKKHTISFPLLSDHDLKLIMAFGILNDDMKKGTFYYGVPHPAIYVIDPTGLITHRFSEDDYKLRPDIDAVLYGLTNEPEDPLIE